MREQRRYAWWSVGISVAVHLLVTTLFLQMFSSLRSAPSTLPAHVDCRIARPDDYPPVSVSLADSPVRSKRPQQPNLSGQGSLSVPSDFPETSRHANAIPDERSSTSELNSHPTGAQKMDGDISEAAPLHGKFTRPGSSIVYVLDRSGSMAKERKLEYAIAVLKASLLQLGPDVLFQIVTYDSRASNLRLSGNLELVSANSANIQEAQMLLDELRGEGSSRHDEGLRVGLALHPDVLILLTDADDLSSKEVQRIKHWNLKGTSIHAVLLGESIKSHSPLRQLTGANQVHTIDLPNQPALMP